MTCRHSAAARLDHRHTSAAARLPGLCFLLFAGLSAPAQDSALRLRIERLPDSPWPAAVGSVELWPSLSNRGEFKIVTDDGTPVRFQTLWTATAEPSLIRFNALNGATAYYLTFDPGVASASGSWSPEAGVLLETRACREQPVNTREQVSKLLNSAGPPLGRSFVPNIFLGINPQGPSADYLALFSGWFNAPRAGEYGFATISQDASWLEVDGRLVAEWLGRHDPHGGRRGQHSGSIPLKAGAHHIEYVQTQFRGEPAAVAAWKPPGEDRYEVMPPAAFLPVARFHVTKCERGASGPAPLYFEWKNVEHCAVADALLVKVRFYAVNAGTRRTWKWRFDDGEQATGQSVQHFFLQAGLREVALEAWDGGACVATNIVRVHVHQNWPQRADWEPDAFAEAKRDFLRRDLSRMPPHDLAYLLELADRADDHQLLMYAGETLLKRHAEFDTPASASAFYNLGLVFQHEGDWGDNLAEKSFRLALMPQHSSPGVTEKVKLRLADLLIHCSGQFDEAEKLLAGLSVAGFAPEERRLERLLRGDLSLARGEVEAAQKQYEAVGDAVDKPGGRFDIGLVALRESASLALERGDFEEAQHTLDRVAFQVPLERLSVETGLLRLALDFKRKEYQRAFTRSRTLLSVAHGKPQESAVLGALVQSALQLGKSDEAQRALGLLLKEFPYSEAAAKAKDLWAMRK